MATVLDLVKATLVRLQLPAANAAVGNADPYVAQILAALTASATELLARYPVNRQLPDGNWLKSAAGTPSDTIKLDTDVVLIDRPLVEASMLWRWRSDQGFDYAEDFRAVEERLSRLGNDYTKAQRGSAIQL